MRHLFRGHRPLLEGRPLFLMETESEPEEETLLAPESPEILYLTTGFGQVHKHDIFELEVPWAPAVLRDDVCKYLMLTELSDLTQFSFLTPSQVIK